MPCASATGIAELFCSDRHAFGADALNGRVSRSLRVVVADRVSMVHGGYITRADLQPVEPAGDPSWLRC